MFTYVETYHKTKGFISTIKIKGNSQRDYIARQDSSSIKISLVFKDFLIKCYYRLYKDKNMGQFFGDLNDTSKAMQQISLINFEQLAKALDITIYIYVNSSKLETKYKRVDFEFKEKEEGLSVVLVGSK